MSYNDGAEKNTSWFKFLAIFSTLVEGCVDTPQVVVRKDSPAIISRDRYAYSPVAHLWSESWPCPCVHLGTGENFFRIVQKSILIEEKNMRDANRWHWWHQPRSCYRKKQSSAIQLLEYQILVFSAIIAMVLCSVPVKCCSYTSQTQIPDASFYS